MKKIIIIIFSTLVLTTCSSQEKDIVYLDFKSNNSDTCNISVYRDGRNKKKVTFIYKKDTLKNSQIRFKICNQIFVFNPKNQTKKVVSIDNVNVSTIDYLFNKLEENPFELTKKTVVKKIYILEKMHKKDYMCYEVLWKDSHIEQRFEKQ